MKDQTPLYEKIRPKNLDEVLSNKILINIIKKWVENSTLKSFVISGKPGSGKTTIIRALLNQIENDYEIYSISGAIEGSKTLKKIINIEENLFSKQKILFVDEIHRLNRSEQDTLLLALEKGDIILMGATTENPAISLNPALLSRLLLFKVQNLSDDDYEKIFQKIKECYPNSIISNEVKNLLKDYFGDDIRRLINLLEAIFESGEKEINKEIIANFISTNLTYNIEDKYNYISAYIKSIRGSDPDAALLYLSYMLENGEDPMYIARRIVVHASEDIGLADPNALNIAVSAMIATEHIGYPECYLALSEATIYLCSTSKSNSVLNAYNKAKEFMINNKFEIPKKLLNPLNKTMKSQGFGKGYKYPHDYGGFYKYNYMPDKYKDKIFYEPLNKGLEKKIKIKLQNFWKDIKKYNEE
ncbi:replication-associated recombination protein A [Oceanotoga teriensis]|uniref:replication-associated recombination protein A n=1 Tax=Oceanotoga teriensis TaxID=515440 RepID=UPI002712CEF3|nr:replication-associated recombination protein A [Oceanotoga teriensis]MDO7976693.1 replication-associated recombination protein A [Oceanotoga teriensis]